MAAQIAPALFSTLVWIVCLATAPQGLATLWAAAALLVTARSTRFGLWWRFGARPASDFERDSMQDAIVSFTCLRGRKQPSVWIATRLNGSDVLMPGSRILIVRTQFMAAVAAGLVGEDQVCARVAHALGQQQVHSSVVVAVGGAYCWPGALGAMVVDWLSRRGAHVGMASFAWRIRWLVLCVAVADNCLNQRWPALVGVVIIGILSWTTPRFASQWGSKLLALGDRRVIAEGLGPTLAAMIRYRSSGARDLERVSRLLKPRSDWVDVNVRNGSSFRAFGDEATSTSGAQP